MASRLAVLLVVVASVSAADELQEGLYTLRNVNSGMYLDVEGGSNENVANVLAWNTPGESHSQWHLRSIGAAFTLQNAQSGMYLSTPVVESSGNGANVFVWDAADLPESQWHIHAVSNGDGTAYTVENEQIGRFLSVAGASIESGANVHLWSSPGKTESQWELLSEGSCHDAVPDEVCYNDTIWAKDYAINTRPEWYPRLTNESSFADFQAHLHYCHWDRCPMPCANTSQQKCEMVGRFWSSDNCQDATEGNCYRSVERAMKLVKIRPGLTEQWYPGLTEQSSFRQFQFHLFKYGVVGCPEPCCPEPCCHDALPGERCHEDVAWAMSHGINIPEVSHAYPQSLTNQSGFAEFQAYLHACYPDRCPKPCASTEVMALQHVGGMDCPDTHKF
mmetsp:Transcript_62392/g.157887  ORF Transcript_62392/g.157887 Transcript_62392/m.157887 type:complete len:390 (-) Transcript_62392:222-1391(-)